MRTTIEYPTLDEIPSPPIGGGYATFIDLLVDDPGNPGSSSLGVLTDANQRPEVMYLEVEHQYVVCVPSQSRISGWFHHTPVYRFPTEEEVLMWVLGLLEFADAFPDVVQDAWRRSETSNQKAWEKFSAEIAHRREAAQLW